MREIVEDRVRWAWCNQVAAADHHLCACERCVTGSGDNGCTSSQYLGLHRLLMAENSLPAPVTGARSALHTSNSLGL